MAALQNWGYLRLPTQLHSLQLADYVHIALLHLLMVHVKFDKLLTPRLTDSGFHVYMCMHNACSSYAMFLCCDTDTMTGVQGSTPTAAASAEADGSAAQCTHSFPLLQL